MKLQKLKWLLDKNDRIFIHAPTDKFMFSPDYLHKTINKKLNITYHNKRVLPNDLSLEKQIVAAKTKCAGLGKRFSDRGLILDDELSFKLTRSPFNDNGSYPTSETATTQFIFKFDTKVKFEDNIFV